MPDPKRRENRLRRPKVDFSAEDAFRAKRVRDELGRVCVGSGVIFRAIALLKRPYEFINRFPLEHTDKHTDKQTIIAV